MSIPRVPTADTSTCASTAGVDWQRMDLSYLQGSRYASAFAAALAAAAPLSGPADVAGAAPGRDYVLRYNSQKQYEAVTGWLGMLREWKVSTCVQAAADHPRAHRAAPPPSTCRMACHGVPTTAPW